MAKNAHIEVGLYRFPVKLDPAVDKESSNAHTICTGPEDDKHDPIRVKQSVACPTCETSHSSVFGFPERGVETDGKVVPLTAEEVAASKGAPIKDLALSFHPRDQVYSRTVAGDSVQNIAPGAGGEKGYSALRDYLASRPDLVAVTVWSPSTANALWVVEVFGDRLVASKRSWPEYVRAVPAMPVGDYADFEIKMLGQTVEMLACDFEVTQYVDAARKGMAELVASRTGDAVAITVPGAAPTASSADMLAALQATLDQAAKKPAAKKAATRKRAAKKVATKPPLAAAG